MPRGAARQREPRSRPTDTITIAANGDPTFVDAGLRSGDLDVALVEGSQLKRLSADDSLVVAKFTSLSYDWIGMNVTIRRSPNIDVRKAIRLAIDVPAIIEVAYDGASPTSDGGDTANRWASGTGRMRRCTTATSLPPSH